MEEATKIVTNLEGYKKAEIDPKQEKSIYQQKIDICNSLITRKDRRKYCKQHHLDWKDVGKDSKQLNDDKLKELPKSDFPWKEYFEKLKKKDYSKIPKYQPIPKSSEEGGIKVDSVG